MLNHNYERLDVFEKDRLRSTLLFMINTLMFSLVPGPPATWYYLNAATYLATSPPAMVPPFNAYILFSNNYSTIFGNTPDSIVVRFGNNNTVIHDIKCRFEINEDTYIEFNPLSIAFVTFSTNSIIAMEVDIFFSETVLPQVQ